MMRSRLEIKVSGFVAALVVACSPASAPPAISPSPEGIPTVLRGYRMTTSEPIPERDGGGTLYRFNDGSGAYLTVFIYPVPDDVKQTDDSGQWVIVEGRKFVQVMPIQVQRGRYDAYEMAFADPEPVIVGRDTIPGFAAAAVTRSRGVVSVQLEYLYLVRGQFLKVRATLPQENWQKAVAPLFARDLAQIWFTRK